MMEDIREIYISAVLNRPVISETGRELGRLWDLIITPGEVFPAVSHLLVKRKSKVLSIPWPEVSLFNQFVVSVNARAAKPAPYIAREGEILVRRDILDKQIVDVDGAKVVRVNDL